MAKESANEKYERIREYVDQYAHAYYDGVPEKGFRHWAFNELFLEYNPSDTDIIDKTQIDGPDDFGIDGYYVEDADDAKVIHLFQCKYRRPGTNMGDSELLELLDAPAKLLNKALIVECRNEETKGLHDELTRLLPKGFSLRLVWATSGTLSTRAKKYVEENTAKTLSAEINSQMYNVDVLLEAYDLGALLNLFQGHLEGDDLSPCNVELEVDSKWFHEVPGEYKTLELTVPARQIIDIFREHKYKIFRLNPRGPLGNKTNAEMKRTLLDETLRHIFHLLNNGISAICQSYKLSKKSKDSSTVTISIREFLIVNGCQTTVTLDSVRPIVKDDPRVLVNLRLVEAPQPLHRLIARTTNRQAPLRAEDFVSTDTIQVELQKQFDALRPPWFYQIKRSEWSRMTPRTSKERYLNEAGTYRWLKSKDVAQVVVAFLGYPGEAKDKIRFFFESTPTEFDNLSYKDIYTGGLSAIQLLLPAVMHKRTNVAVDKDKADIQLGADLDWLDYARLHLLWLSGELLRRKYRLGKVLLPKELSQVLIGSIQSWGEPLYLTARASIKSAVTDLKRSDKYRGHREFFRSSGNYPLILGKLPDALDFARSLGLDPIAKLPSG